MASGKPGAVHIVTAVQPRAQYASLQSRASQKTQPRRRVRLRPSLPSRPCPGRPQRTRSTVPMTRRFRHNFPRLSSVSRCLGPTQVLTPFHHLSGDSHHHDPLLGAGPITASSWSRPESGIPGLGPAYRLSGCNPGELNHHSCELQSLPGARALVPPGEAPKRQELCLVPELTCFFQAGVLCGSRTSLLRSWIGRARSSSYRRE